MGWLMIPEELLYLDPDTQPAMTYLERMVLLRIAARCGRTNTGQPGECWESGRHMAAAMQASRSAVQKAIKHLIELNLIVVNPTYTPDGRAILRMNTRLHPRVMRDCGKRRYAHKQTQTDDEV